MSWTRRRFIVLAGAVVVICGFVVALTWANPEPSYQGRSLNQWLAALDNPTNTTYDQIGEALRGMGAQAAVRLVPMVEASDSRLKWWLIGLAGKLHFKKIPFTLAAFQSSRAEKAFEIMGEKAIAAAPGLVSILIRRASDPNIDPSQRAFRALVCLGPGAIPDLRPALCSPNSQARDLAISVLASYGFSPTPETTPDLLKLLDDANPLVKAAGITALGMVHRDPETVIPRIEVILGDANPEVRQQAAIALGRFGREASNSVAALRRACSDPASQVGKAAEHALAEIAGTHPATKPANDY